MGSGESFNEEFHRSYILSNKPRMIKPRILRRTRHVARIGYIQNFKSAEKRSSIKPRRRWADDITTGLKKLMYI